MPRSTAPSQDSAGAAARVVFPPVCSCRPWLGCATPPAERSLHPLFHTDALARYPTGHQGWSWRLEVRDQGASGPVSPEASLGGVWMAPPPCPHVSTDLCPAGQAWSFRHGAGRVPRGQRLVPLGRQGGLWQGQGCQGADGGEEARLKGRGGGSLGPKWGPCPWPQATGSAYPQPGVHRRPSQALRNALYKCKFPSKSGSLVQQAISVALSVQFFTLCVSVLCLGQSCLPGPWRVGSWKSSALQTCRQAHPPGPPQRGRDLRHGQAAPGQGGVPPGLGVGGAVAGWGEPGEKGGSPFFRLEGSGQMGWGRGRGCSA